LRKTLDNVNYSSVGFGAITKQVILLISRKRFLK
jgi:hypothetical protein